MNHKQLILFDGLCQFCNGAVNFIIKRDKQGRFVFASIQSPLGQVLLDKYDLLDKPDTFALINAGRCITMSSAVICVAKQFGGLWRSVIVFSLIPKGLRDYAYEVFGRHRYRLFGKLDACVIPTPEVKARFVEELSCEQW